MSFIHYLFLGHFEHDGARVRFAKRSSQEPYKPVVRRPLDLEMIKDLLPKECASDESRLAFPADWSAWLEDGYLVCNKYTRNREEIDFLARFAQRVGCEVYDVAAHGEIALHEWLAASPEYSRL